MRFLILAIVVLAASAPVNGVQDPNEDVDQMIRTAARPFINAGFQQAPRAFYGLLENGQQRELDIGFDPGEFKVLAVCHPRSGCADLDVTLHDLQGREVARDPDLNKEVSFVIIEATIRQKQDFKLHVRMARCTRSPCRYAITSFMRNR